MAQGHAVSLLIALPPEQTQLSKAQKTFNTLVQKIEKRRSEPLRWQSAVEQIQKNTARFCSSGKIYRAAQADLVHALDAVFVGAGLTKPERAMLKKVICNRHSPVDYDTGEARTASYLRDA